jgi:hypothetical protein
MKTFPSVSILRDGATVHKTEIVNSRHRKILKSHYFIFSGNAKEGSIVKQESTLTPQGALVIMLLQSFISYCHCSKLLTEQNGTNPR